MSGKMNSNGLKNFFLVILLIVVVVLSFWVSFMVGKKMLVPARSLPVRPIMPAETIPALPPEVTLEAKIVSLEVVRVEKKPEVQEVKKETTVAKKTAKKKKKKNFALSAPFTVQLGVFKVRENADTLSTELAKKGFSVEIYDQGSLIRVYSGKFKNTDEAAEHLKEIQEAGYEGIVKRDF
jgi:cell division protein FtsN